MLLPLKKRGKKRQSARLAADAIPDGKGEGMG